MLFLLYTATFLFGWFFSRNPFFATLLAFLISTALFCWFLFSTSNMKSLVRFLAILILVQSAQADQFKVHYSIHGSGKDIIVNANQIGVRSSTERDSEVASARVSSNWRLRKSFWAPASVSKVSHSLLRPLGLKISKKKSAMTSMNAPIMYEKVTDQ
jgi:hypothetical protein